MLAFSSWQPSALTSCSVSASPGGAKIENLNESVLRKHALLSGKLSFAAAREVQIICSKTRDTCRLLCYP